MLTPRTGRPALASRSHRHPLMPSPGVYQRSLIGCSVLVRPYVEARIRVPEPTNSVGTTRSAILVWPSSPGTHSHQRPHPERLLGVPTWSKLCSTPHMARANSPSGNPDGNEFGLCPGLAFAGVTHGLRPVDLA